MIFTARMRKGAPMAKSKIQVIVNLPDDWIEQVVNRLRNDPNGEWVDVIRCKDCKYYVANECRHPRAMVFVKDSDFCSYAERRHDAHTEA